MKKWKAILINSCLNLIYPRVCLHCEEKLKDDYFILCESCLKHLEPAAVNDRCRRCYDIIESALEHPFCLKCFKSPSPFYRALCPFEASEPLLSLHAKLRSASTSFLSKGLGAFMAYAYLREDLDLPDIIVAVPQVKLNQLFNGHNLSYLLAVSIAKIMNVPLVSGLKVKGVFQANDFCYNSKIKFENKKVLLIGDCLNEDFFKAGNALIEGCPHSILGLALFKR